MGINVNPLNNGAGHGININAYNPLNGNVGVNGGVGLNAGGNVGLSVNANGMGVTPNGALHGNPLNGAGTMNSLMGGIGANPNSLTNGTSILR